VNMRLSLILRLNITNFQKYTSMPINLKSIGSPFRNSPKSPRILITPSKPHAISSP
jgi:hypothetical protein